VSWHLDELALKTGARLAFAFDPLQTLARHIKPIVMDRSDNELSSLTDGYWKVQPGWVKALTIIIGLPAFIVLVSGAASGTPENIAMGAFIAVALPQLIFVLRAYWRMDL